MSINDNRRNVQNWSKIVRICILGLVLLGAVITSATDGQWVILKGGNSIARIWFCASLLITGIFSVWLNHSLHRDERYSRNYLSKYKSDMYLINISVLLYVVVFFLLIFLGVIKDTRLLGIVGGPLLVGLVWLFDSRVISMEKAILNKDKGEKNMNNIMELRKSIAVVRHLDIPIFIGVCSVAVACLILTPIQESFPDFIPGFASGATSMQIIVGNITYEIIRG